MKWIKLSTKFPEDWITSIIRHRHTKELITQERVNNANHDFFEMEDGETISYTDCEYLDESPPSIDIKALWEEFRTVHYDCGTIMSHDQFINAVNKILNR